MTNYRLQVSREWIKRFGVLKYVAHSCLGLFKLSRLDTPAIYQSLMKAAESIDTDPFVVTDCIKSKKRFDLEKESTQLQKLIRSRLSRGEFPANWNSGIGTAILLYLMIRRSGYLKVLEIGTGNGVSTLASYRALKANSVDSMLVTVDTSKFAGSILNHKERSAIDFQIVKPDLKSKKRMFSKLHSLQPDLVFVDGAHDYLNVINDLEMAFKLKPRVLIADDIEVNDAWQDFCLQNRLNYKVFLDGRKVLGICFLS